MNWFLIIITYLTVWWIVLFMVLPFGVHKPTKEEKIPGQSEGAPARPHLGKKLIANTILALLVTTIIILGVDTVSPLSFYGTRGVVHGTIF